MKVILLLACLGLVAPLTAGEETETDRWLKDLASDDLMTRYAAMDKLQTSLDPRLPDACLAVLEKDGSSIRRRAARAIGSRWW